MMWGQFDPHGMMARQILCPHGTGAAHLDSNPIKAPNRLEVFCNTASMYDVHHSVLYLRASPLVQGFVVLYGDVFQWSVEKGLLTAQDCRICVLHIQHVVHVPGNSCGCVGTWEA